MECEFCKKVFKTKYTLSTHQTTAKNCLLLQGKTDGEESSNYECNFCDKKFSRIYHLERHEDICKIKKQEEHKKIKSQIRQEKEYEKEINELKIKNAEQQKEIEMLKEHINYYKEEIKDYKVFISNNERDKTSILKDAVNKPNNIQKINNKTFTISTDQLPIFNKENIITRLDRLKPRDFHNKIDKFCSIFANMLKDMVVTVDFSRGILVIKNEESKNERIHCTNFVEKALKFYDISKLEEKFKKSKELLEEFEKEENSDPENIGLIRTFLTDIYGQIRDYKKGATNKLVAGIGNQLSEKCYKKSEDNENLLNNDIEKLSLT
jgi:hypothetical protein